MISLVVFLLLLHCLFVHLFVPFWLGAIVVDLNLHGCCDGCRWNRFKEENDGLPCGIFASVGEILGLSCASASHWFVWVM